VYSTLTAGNPNTFYPNASRRRGGDLLNHAHITHLHTSPLPRIFLEFATL
jgi:hypothetical protein